MSTPVHGGSLGGGGGGQPVQIGAVGYGGGGSGGMGSGTYMLKTDVQLAKERLTRAAEAIGEVHIQWAHARQELRDAHKAYAKELGRTHGDD